MSPDKRLNRSTASSIIKPEISYKKNIKTFPTKIVCDITLRLPSEYFAAEKQTGYPQIIEKFWEYIKETRTISIAH